MSDTPTPPPIAPITAEQLMAELITAIAEFDAAKAEAMERSGNWADPHVYNSVEARCRAALSKTVELWLDNRDRVRFLVWADPEYAPPVGDVITAQHTPGEDQ